MDKLTVLFTQKEHRRLGPLYGTIRIILKCKGENCINKKTEIRASDVYPPFWELLNFLEKVYEKKLPTEFRIDIEGLIIIFKANNTEIDEVIEFKIFKEINGEYGHTTPETYFQGLFNSYEFVNEFVTQFRNFLDHDYKSEYWEEVGGSMPLNKLKELEKIIKKS